MARATKKPRESAGDKAEFSLFDEPDGREGDFDEEDLPKDEAGRAKIKQQYVDLLGIRIGKLKGRILNRERINKTLEGIYFICARCERVCHNLDDGLVEDEENVNNLCAACQKALTSPPKAAKPKKSPAAKRSKTSTAKKPAKSPKKKSVQK